MNHNKDKPRTPQSNTKQNLIIKWRSNLLQMKKWVRDTNTNWNTNDLKYENGLML